jgi:hypothetical protein
VPNWRLETIADKPVLLLPRFDRAAATRVPFLSAMSMLDRRDNEAAAIWNSSMCSDSMGRHPNRICRLSGGGSYSAF